MILLNIINALNITRFTFTGTEKKTAGHVFDYDIIKGTFYFLI